MLKFYEMMYYAVHRKRLEGQDDSYGHGSRLYSFLVFLNVTTLLFLLNRVLQWQRVFIADAWLYCFIIGGFAGMVLDWLMGRRGAAIKAKFENSDGSEISTWLLVYTIFSFAFFMVIILRSKGTF